MARYQPANLTHVVFDNESLLSVGGFPTATSTGTDLAGVAKAAGVPETTAVESVETLSAAFVKALESHTLNTIVAKVDAHYAPPTGTTGFVTQLGLLENRFQFQRHLADLADT